VTRSDHASSSYTFSTTRNATTGEEPPLLKFGNRRRLCGAAVAGILVLAGCSFPGTDEGPDVDPTQLPVAGSPPAGTKDPAADPALARYYGQRLAWSGCGDDLECASLTVPLDWAKPGGGDVKVALLRRPADGKRIGSLVVNPGGPGVSGKAYAQAADRAFGRPVTSHYDVVGFDPRGVGDSTAITCLPDSQLDGYLAADSTPDSPAELTQIVASTRRFAEACEKNSGALVRHVDTISVVKDMDALRAALGEKTLAFLGASYGTYIGAWYAQLFPWRVGRFVLDGAVDPALTSEQYIAGQAEGFTRALRAFVSDCQSTKGCPLRGNLQDGLSQVGLLVDAADEDPLSTDSGRELTQNLMITGIAQGLYDDAFYPVLTTGLEKALQGDGTDLLRLADLYYQRDDEGRYGQTVSANPAIFCLDVAEKRTPAQIEADAAELDKQFPPLGGALGWGAMSCAEWPVPAVVPRQKLTAQGAAPILVLGTTGDPATPYEWAQALASELSSASLLTWEGDVHTAYNRGNRCVDDAVEGYLLTGAMPAEGTRCR
jgi:pimeloyl-ACP methyl ester carboxylesterase